MRKVEWSTPLVVVRREEIPKSIKARMQLVLFLAGKLNRGIKRFMWQGQGKQTLRVSFSCTGNELSHLF